MTTSAEAVVQHTVESVASTAAPPQPEDRSSKPKRARDPASKITKRMESLQKKVDKLTEENKKLKEEQRRLKSSYSRISRIPKA